MQTQTANARWYIKHWGFWGWFETIVKLVGVGAGLIALGRTNFAAGAQLVDLPHGISVIILTLLSLPLVPVVGLRFRQREVVSLIFSILNALGHVAMLIHLLFVPQSQFLPLVFGGAYVIGEAIKQRFLILTGYTEMNLDHGTMVKVVRGLMVIYLVFVATILL